MNNEIEERKDVEDGGDGREILFRAWEPDFKKMFNVTEMRWVEGHILVGTDAITTKKFYVPATFSSKIIMQYTGFKDKNGKKIFEGDILDCQDRIAKVVWHKQAGQFDTVFVRHISDLCSNGITNQEWKYRATVIGNIYENPELLEQGNE